MSVRRPVLLDGAALGHAQRVHELAKDMDKAKERIQLEAARVWADVQQELSTLIAVELGKIAEAAGLDPAAGWSLDVQYASIGHLYLIPAEPITQAEPIAATPEALSQWAPPPGRKAN